MLYIPPAVPHPGLLAIASVPAAHTPATTSSGGTGTLVVILLVATLMVVLWRPVLRLVAIGVIALLLLGVTVLVSEARAPATEPAPPAVERSVDRPDA